MQPLVGNLDCTLIIKICEDQIGMSNKNEDILDKIYTPKQVAARHYLARDAMEGT